MFGPKTYKLIFPLKLNIEFVYGYNTSSAQKIGEKVKTAQVLKMSFGIRLSSHMKATPQRDLNMYLNKN